MNATPIERFWAKVHRGGPDECWNWTACRLNVKGRLWYGRLQVDGRAVHAHRFSWALANGPIPEGAHVLHRCDNAMCVNPAHLFLGTHVDNMADMVAKKRAYHTNGFEKRPPRGERHWKAKLSAHDVVAIRSMAASGQSTRKEIAARFGVTKAHVGYIVRNDCWAHLAHPSTHNVSGALITELEK